MSPFMRETVTGKQSVNFIRIIEQLIGGAIIGAILLWGSHQLLGQKVETMAVSFTNHVQIDREMQQDLQDWRIQHHEMLIRHQTLLERMAIRGND